MTKSKSLSQSVTNQLLEILEGEPSPKKLNDSLRLLGKWRARLLENTLIAQSGTKVLSGPFQGLDYSVSASEGGRIPRLLGCYEKTLHPIFDHIIDQKPALIIDVGCAEGYYAVGLALRLRRATIWARDMDETAQEKCRELAEVNGVAGRVKVGGELTHADFDICRAQHTVVICDIEGAEAVLMDPEKAKGLRRADILIEVHETGSETSLLDALEERFAQTHTAQRLHRDVSTQSLPDWMEGLSDMDRLIALWEWRAIPTPWLWLTAKHR